MRFLVDENTGPTVARWLRDQGHEVFSIFEEARGMDDDAVIHKAYAEGWILLTNDKDLAKRCTANDAPTRASFSCAWKMSALQTRY